MSLFSEIFNFLNGIFKFYYRGNVEDNNDDVIRENVAEFMLANPIVIQNKKKKNISQVPYNEFNLIQSDLVPNYEQKEDKIEVVQIDSKTPFNIGLNNSGIAAVKYEELNANGQCDLDKLKQLFERSQLSSINTNNDYISTPKPVTVKRIREYSPGRTHSREIMEGPPDLVVGYVRVVNENIVFNWDDDKEKKVINALTITGQTLSCGKGLLSLCCNAIRYWENQLKFILRDRLLITLSNADRKNLPVFTHGYYLPTVQNVMFPATILTNSYFYDLDDKRSYRCHLQNLPKSCVFLNIFDKLNYVASFDNIGFAIFIPSYMISSSDIYFNNFKIDTENGYLIDGDFKVPFLIETIDMDILSSIEYNGFYLLFYKIKKNNIGSIYYQSSIVRNYHIDNKFKITENFNDNTLTIHVDGITYEESLSEIYKMAMIISGKALNDYSQFCRRVKLLQGKEYIILNNSIDFIKKPLFMILNEMALDIDLSNQWNDRKLDFGTCRSDYTLNKSAVELDLKHFYDVRDSNLHKSIFNIAKNFSTIVKLTNKNKLGIDDLFNLLENDFNNLIANCNLNNFKEQMLAHFDNYNKMYTAAKNKNDKRFCYRKTNVFLNDYEKISVIKKFAAYMNMFRVNYKSLTGNVVISPYNTLRIPKVLFNIYKAIYLSYLKVEDVPCTCTMHKTKYINIIPTSYEQDENILYYNSCLRTVFSSIKRHCMFVVQPDYYEVLKFKDYVVDDFSQLKLKLGKIGYSYEKWFDHLNARKQLDIIVSQDKINKGGRYPNKVKHDMFTKVEKQSKNEKTRTIMGVNTIVKNVTGPIDWMIENDFSTSLGFYSGKKNVDDYNEEFKKLSDEGFNDAFEGDGSAFDITQHVFLKFIDEVVYDYYLQDINLIEYNKTIEIDDEYYDISFKVDRNYLRKLLLQPIKVLQARRNFTKDFIFVEVVGTVFSGSTSTTCMNTIRNYYLNRYTTRQCLNIRYFTKGDDFIAFYKGVTFELVKMCYEHLWSCKDSMFSKVNKGLGVVMKKLIRRTIKNIHFCSNFIISDGKNFIFVRELDRLLKFGGYSRKAVLYSSGQLKQYLIDLADALKACNLHNKPFYRIYYNQYIKYAGKINAEPKPIAKGRVKIHLTSEKDVELEKYNIDNDEYHDYYYSRLFHDTKVDLDMDAFSRAIFEQYGLTDNDEAILNEFFENSNLGTDYVINDKKIAGLIQA